MSFDHRLTFCLVVLPAISLAQSQQPGQLPTDPNPPAAKQSNSTPLSLGGKYRLALHRSVDPLEFVRIGLGAGIDQARNYPAEWGQGWDAFSVRTASGFGQHLIKEQIEFAVWATDHEDPRHHRSGLHGIWPRMRFAVIHTFVTKRDDGKQMLSYSRFIADYGAGFISRQWYPDRFHTALQGIDAGSVSLGIDVGINVAREFVPHWLIH